MSITVVDSGGSLFYHDDVNDIDVYFNKQSFQSRRKGSEIWLNDEQYSENFDFAEVTTTEPDGAAWLVSLNALLPSGGGGGGGDASAANQSTQIGIETTIASNTSDNATETTLQLISSDVSTASNQAAQIDLQTLIESNTSTNATEATVLASLAELVGVNASLSKATASDVTSVPANDLVAETLKASNVSRKSLLVTNDGDNTLYLKYGTGASLTSWTIFLGSGDQAIIDDFTGEVTGIWDIATGSARITETT